MNWQRFIFLWFICVVLFTIKLIVIGQIQAPIIYPDETVYGFSYGGVSGWAAFVSNLSIYSVVPFIFGRTGALVFNAFLTSMCSVLLFILFRQNTSERNASILTVLASLSGALWLYSFVNMTEAMLFFITLGTACLWRTDGITKILGCNFYNSHIFSTLAVLTKPVGVPLFLVHYRYGFFMALVLGLVFGLAYSTPMGIQEMISNAVMGTLRTWWYVLFASLGFAFFTGYKVLRGKGDWYDWFAISLILVTYAATFAGMIKIPHAYYFGRYFDASILVMLTTIGRPIYKDKWFGKALLLVVAIALIYPCLTNFNMGGLMDAGILPFAQVIQNVLTISDHCVHNACGAVMWSVPRH